MYKYDYTLNAKVVFQYIGIPKIIQRLSKKLASIHAYEFYDLLSITYEQLPPSHLKGNIGQKVLNQKT